MSTLVRVTAYARSAPDWNALGVLVQSRAALYDHREPTSAVAKLNRDGRAATDERLQEVIEVATAIAAASDGAFDPTILPLTELWDFDLDGRLPAEAEIDTARRLVAASALVMADGWVRFADGSHGGVDLGAIAKGAVVDEIGVWLEERGITAYLVDAGGDILVFGLKPGGESWRIAIVHPRGDPVPLAVITIGAYGNRVSLVTSGDYERFFRRE